LKTSGIPAALSNVVFTVNELSKLGRLYASGHNHDPDGDSNGTTFMIGSPLLMHVGDLDRKAGTDASGWWGQVTIRVHKTNHAAVAGALVIGAWTGDTVEVAQCTTNSAGYCRMKRSGFPSSLQGATFTVDAITKPGLTYFAGANHDPDPDSNGTTIAVSNPVPPAVGALTLTAQ
jgi:hypothetical protein